MQGALEIYISLGISMTHGLNAVFVVPSPPCRYLLGPRLTMQGSKHGSDGAQYAFPTWRKCLILTDACFVVFTSSSALCSMFPATAQIAAELSTTVETLHIANACVQIAMGISLFVWQPIRSFIGRRNAYLLAILTLFCFSIGAALAINASMFIAMRIIVGITGTFLLVAGQELLAETFDPVSRNSTGQA